MQERIQMLIGKIKLRLRGKAARLAEERPWPEDMTFKWINKDEAILTVTIQGTNEILLWIMSQGDEVEILSPKELREELKSKLSKLIKIYKNG